MSVLLLKFTHFSFHDFVVGRYLQAARMLITKIEKNRKVKSLFQE
jgi:hypothetical protein